MLKRWTIVVLCLIAVLSFSACTSSTDQSGESETSMMTSDISESSSPEDSVQASESGEKIQVSVSFNAMKEFVEAVGGERVEISTIIPDGMEPHDFEPKAQDLVGLSTAQVFVYNGLGMEAWVEEAISAANNSGLIAVEASKGAEAIENTDPEEIEEHGQYDPHLWLSLKGAEIEVNSIKDALVQADPESKDYYEANCNDYVSQLENLYNEYAEKFRNIAKKDFVTGHAAFGYLCRDFGLEQNSVEDTFAEGEPSAQQLVALVEYCRENNVSTIFTEEMASPDVSETLANEVGAKVETIYTMESAEDNMTYLERIDDNLSKIYDSLAN